MTRGEQGPTRPNLKGLGRLRWMLRLGLGQKLEWILGIGLVLSPTGLVWKKKSYLKPDPIKDPNLGVGLSSSLTSLRLGCGWLWTQPDQISILNMTFFSFLFWGGRGWGWFCIRFFFWAGQGASLPNLP